jgi:hypothetical protein
MFAGLSAQSCTVRRRRQKSPLPPMLPTARSDTSGSTSARAADQNVNSMRSCDGFHGASRDDKTVLMRLLDKGLHLPSLRVPSAIPLFKALAGSGGNYLSSTVQTRNSEASHPRKVKRSTPRQLAVSRILAQSHKLLGGPNDPDGVL